MVEVWKEIENHKGQFKQYHDALTVNAKPLAAIDGNTFELNKEYYDKACKRIKLEQAQPTLF